MYWFSEEEDGEEEVAFPLTLNLKRKGSSISGSSTPQSSTPLTNGNGYGTTAIDTAAPTAL